jgi:hypothetical protein
VAAALLQLLEGAHGHHCTMLLLLPFSMPQGHNMSTHYINRRYS